MATIACVCPPRAGGQTRHPNGDTVTLRPRLGFKEAIACRKSIQMLYEEDDTPDMGEVLASFTESYIVYGIESWTLEDEDGKPLPVDRPHIRAFLAEHIEEAAVVGDEADGLYTQAVMLPLLVRALSSSPPTPTDESTSAGTGSTSSSETPPTPSSPSSTSTSQTDDIETTSPPLVGVSN